MEKLKLYIIIGVLLLIVFLGNKNKININFSKKENKRILYVVLGILIYFNYERIQKQYEGIKADIQNPGTGSISKKYNQIKQELEDLDTGYGKIIKRNVLKLFKRNEIEETDYEISRDLKQQLKEENYIAVIGSHDGKVYGLKENPVKRKKYLLESKINRDIMTVDSISVDEYDIKYQDIYKTLDFDDVILLKKSVNINTIFKKPNTKNLKKNDFEIMNHL